MVQATGAPIAEYFAALDDPRIDRTKRHKLLDIVTIALCATICGADSWVDIELFGNCKEEWFKSFLELPNGIPSHDTFGDVFARLDPEQFQRCFMEWVQAVAQVTQGEVVAIDGKTVRRSHDRTLGKKAIHMVNVWASSHGLALGQTKVDEKSNEITAIPKLLQLLELAGCIITIDAMGCQREIAREIIEAQADYLLAVKENQGRLYDDVRDLFEGAEEYDFEGVPYDFARTLNKGHGRLETRQCWVITDPDCLDYLQNRQQWANLNAVVKVTAQRETATGTTVHSRYYISSLARPAQTLLEVTRRHWGIENSLHWSLDVTFREDHSRVRKDSGPQNLAVLRQIALNLLKQETSLKRGLQGKRLKAGWVEDYLLKVLGQRELDLGVPDSEAMSIARELLLPFAGSKTVVARVDDHRAENANPPSSGAPSRRHRNGNDGPERDPGPYFWRELRGEQLRLDADSGAMKVARAVPEQSNLLKWAVLYYCRRNGDDGLGRGPEPYLAWRPMATQLELNTRQGSV